MGKKVEVLNLTTHILSVYDADYNFLVDIPPSQRRARYDIEDQKQPDVGGLPVTRKVFKKLYGLPEPRDGVYYIVPALIAQRIKRPDVLSPGTLIRGDNGLPKGCVGLFTYADEE